MRPTRRHWGVWVVAAVLLWAGVRGEWPYGADSRVVRLTGASFDEVVGAPRPMLWAVAFHNAAAGERVAASAAAVERAARHLAHVLHAGAVDCAADAPLCARLGVARYPTLLYFAAEPPAPGAARAASALTGPFTAANIANGALARLPDWVARVDTESHAAFLGIMPRVPKVLFFSAKRAVPPLYKALALVFRGRFNFACVLAGTDGGGAEDPAVAELVDMYRVESYPQVFVIVAKERASASGSASASKSASKSSSGSGDGDDGEYDEENQPDMTQYKGHITFDNMVRFLNDFAGGYYGPAGMVDSDGGSGSGSDGSGDGSGNSNGKDMPWTLAAGRAVQVENASVWRALCEHNGGRVCAVAVLEDPPTTGTLEMVAEFNAVHELAAVERARTQVVWFFRAMQPAWLRAAHLAAADTPLLVRVRPVYSAGSGGNVVREMRAAVHRGPFTVDAMQNFLVAHRKGLRAEDIVVPGTFPVADTTTPAHEQQQKPQDAQQSPKVEL